MGLRGGAPNPAPGQRSGISVPTPGGGGGCWGWGTAPGMFRCLVSQPPGHPAVRPQFRTLGGPRQQPLPWAAPREGALLAGRLGRGARTGREAQVSFGAAVQSGTWARTMVRAEEGSGWRPVGVEGRGAQLN